jgi:hypothetical protein
MSQLKLLRDTEKGIQITQKRLQEFEQKHQMTTEAFIQRYENDELEETLDLAEWVGEYRMLKGLQGHVHPEELTPE